MKRILVISDTHYDTRNLVRTVQLAGPFDAAIHLGDCSCDVRDVTETLGISCVSVRGNCDSDWSIPEEETVEYEGVKLLCLHGHRCHDPYVLLFKGKQAGCRAVLYGHTHVPFCEEAEGVWIVNPGSLSRPRCGSDAGFCVLYIEKGELFIKQFSID